MTQKRKLVGRIIEAIRKAKTICVVGHIRPDGDCVGSQLALTLALTAIGKDVVCWNEDKVPQKYAFLDRRHLISRPRRGRSFDLVISTDAASYERLGTVGDCVRKRGQLINIDHHESNTRFGDINWIEGSDPSCGELVFHLITEAGWKITPEIADCLFTAISTDTGSFQYPSTLPETYNVAGELVRKGADLARVCNEVYQSYPLGRVRLLQHVYNRFRLTSENRIAWFWLKQADFRRTGADSSDSEGLIDHIRDIQPVVVACVFEELAPEVTRVSLRSKSTRVNVSEIAKQFGGGGHPAAAGARIAGRPMTVQRRMIAAIKKALAADS